MPRQRNGDMVDAADLAFQACSGLRWGVINICGLDGLQFFKGFRERRANHPLLEKRTLRVTCSV